MAPVIYSRKEVREPTHMRVELEVADGADIDAVAIAEFDDPSVREVGVTLIDAAGEDVGSCEYDAERAEEILGERRRARGQAAFMALCAAERAAERGAS